MLAVLTAAGCAGARQPSFVPAAREEADRALSAWKDAVAKAEDRSPVRLLYDARVSQGPFRMSGTLAVREGTGALEATLSGPFGDPLARYSEGALRGKGMRPIAIDEEDLRAVLAGAWKGRQPPLVAGVNGGDALLRWSGGAEDVEGTLDVARARFRSVRIRRREGAIQATYPEENAGRPRRIDLEDLSSGNTLRLTLVASEAAPD